MEIAKLYHKISVYITEKILEYLFSMQYKYQTMVVPNITPDKSIHCGVMMSHWPNFTLVLTKLYPKQWGNDELLKFFSFAWTDYCELKPFSEKVL